MKKLFYSSMLAVSLCMILMIPVRAQEQGQKKMHVVIEENGTVITDTSIIFSNDVPEEEIQAIVSGITGEKGHPCEAHNQPAMHCDTVVYKCRQMQKNELDSLLEVSGKPYTYTPSDTCRHAHASCENHTEKAGAGQEPCRHMEKKVIITEEVDKAEKATIPEKPAETKKKAIKEN
jgi:hydroxymethylpyrimidine pyrophosphatase-like HAD family hydrolase